MSKFVSMLARGTLISSLSVFSSLLISCEHAGNQVPEEWQHLFEGHKELLISHRGWDPGAGLIAEALAHAFCIPLYACQTTRVLVEANRSLGHPRLFSAVTKNLSAARKKQILDLYYYPYRWKLEQAAARLVSASPPLLHLAVHSFTPVLEGVTREVEIGILYDPKRGLEKQFSREWKRRLAPLLPDYRIRFNVPYQGIADGVPKAFRKNYTSKEYAGIEIEINQRLLAKKSERKKIIEALIISLKPLLNIS